MNWFNRKVRELNNRIDLVFTIVNADEKTAFELQKRINALEAAQTGESFPLPGGMSLRDWFAGQYLLSDWTEPSKPNDAAGIATSAYAMADAMIEASFKIPTTGD